MTEATLTLYQGRTFQTSITITALGTPTVLNDRAFSGRIASRPGGVTLADFEIQVADQGQYPGKLTLNLDPQATAKIPCSYSPNGMILPSRYVYEVNCTYTNRPGVLEQVVSGLINVIPKIG